jgi:hypothetical protein
LGQFLVVAGAAALFVTVECGPPAAALRSGLADLAATRQDNSNVSLDFPVVDSRSVGSAEAVKA